MKAGQMEQLPGAHDLPEDGEFADVVGVVVGDNQDFAEDVVIRGMGDRRVKIGLGIGDDTAQGLRIT